MEIGNPKPKTRGMKLVNPKFRRGDFHSPAVHGWDDGE
jgi:hypothetical protein